MSVRLFIGNLPYDATEAEINAHFAQTGAPSRIAIPLDRMTGRPRGFAFVDFEDPEVAKAVIRDLDAQPFKSRPLAVREARPREERPPGARPPMGGGRPLGADGGSSRSDSGAGEGPRRTRPAPPRRGGKAERAAPKGPIPVRTTGRFYGDEDQDGPEVELDFDNFATSAPDDESDTGDLDTSALDAESDVGSFNNLGTRVADIESDTDDE